MHFRVEITRNCCEQHTSHVTFSHFFTLTYTHMRGSSRKFGVRTSRVKCHLHALMCLFRVSASIVLSLLSMFPPGRQLHFPRCGGQIPCALLLMRTLAPLPSTTLLTSYEPNDYHISEATELYIHESSVENGSPNDLEYDAVTIGKTLSSPKSEKMMEAVDEPITLKTKVCRPVSRRPSFMIERGESL